MKRALSLLLIACLLILGVRGIADAVTPSGPGQTTAAHSVSVVFASDATLPGVTVTGGATAAHQVTQNGYLDGLETLIGTTNTTLATIDGRVDGIETLIGTTNSSLTTIDGRVDGLETLVTATNASLELLKQPTRTAAVTISDATDVTSTCTKGVWVGTGGNLAVKGAGDSSAVTHKNVPSGTYIPGALSRVMSTNTTAADINCLYGP